MSIDYSYDVGYGFVVRPEHEVTLEALTADFSEDDLPVLSFGLDYEKFASEFPLLKFGTSGSDGENESLVIMMAGSHKNIESKYSGTAGAFELRDSGLINEELVQLITFAGKYGIQGTPSWVAYTSIS